MTPKRKLLAYLALALLALQPACQSPSKKDAPKVVSQADSKKADEFYIQGAYAYANGDTKGAMALWNKTLALNPRHKKALEAMEEARDKMKAVKALKKK